MSGEFITFRVCGWLCVNILVCGTDSTEEHAAARFSLKQSDLRQPMLMGGEDDDACMMKPKLQNCKT